MKSHDSNSWQNNFITGIQIRNQNPWFKPMTILSMKFKSIIKTHGLNPWQFIYPKPNSHWQYQSPILIGNIKIQFSLATSKPTFHWQHQSPVLIGNIKVQFLLAIFKTQFSLTTSKPNSHCHYQNSVLAGKI